MERITYVCVNYNSSDVLDTTLKSWRDAASGINLIVVDNYSSDREVEAVTAVCKKHDAHLIRSENNGYGSSLNKGLAQVINNDENKHDVHHVFFGNVDVVPKCKVEKINLYGKIPVLNITTLGKQENPFLNTVQTRFIWIMCIAARLESRVLLCTWQVIQKLLKRASGKIAAVHGSLFCMEINELRGMHPIFDERVFLYCEELFFMRKVKNNRLEYIKTNLYFEHLGSVSTAMTIKKDKRKFFMNWARSMRLYCEK